MAGPDTLLIDLLAANAQWAKDIEAARPGFFQESVKVVVVGHTECGGATACLTAAQRKTFPEDGPLLTIPTLSYDAPLNQWLEPLTRLVGMLGLSTTPKEEALPVVVEENVKQQVENLSRTATLLNAWASNDSRRNVRVHGWVYSLDTGLLKDLQVTKGAFTRVIE
ncbi:hypothetical protein C0993_011108 [Termitomyces sp. T159_Od127]|nr:hypothetical protein C0993_011108 [Termitomyces sp. T159_Od127]